MRRVLQAITLAAILSGAGVVVDQNNQALDTLFSRLHETSDSVEASGITRQIWNNWYQNDNPTINALMARGEVSLRRARYEDAIKHFSEIIKLDPKFAEGWNRRATAYYVIGKYQLSTEDVAETLKLEPRHFGALSGQGLIYMQLNDVERALKYMKKALEVNPHMENVKLNIEQIEKTLREGVI